jgi:hypothetical protein
MLPIPASRGGYNPLRHVGPQYTAPAASGLMKVFKKMWPDAWGVRMEHSSWRSWSNRQRPCMRLLGVLSQIVPLEPFKISCCDFELGA